MAETKTIKKTTKKNTKTPAKNSTKKVVEKYGKSKGQLSAEIKYEKFAAEYRKNGGNGTQAAIAAGYSEKTASVTASKLLKNAKVVGLIEKMAKDATRKQIINADERAAVLSQIATDNKQDPNARIRAIDILNKMDGLYIIKVEATVNLNISSRLEARRKGINGQDSNK